MKYIFLTFTMGGCAGGPSYVATKLSYLRSIGWDVVVFDHYAGLDLNDKIILPELKEFNSNRYLELFFPPRYFSKRQRMRLLNTICSKIGQDTDYVVESNSARLSLWGELLSQQLKAKHLIFDIGENIGIRTKKEFDFYLYKLKRDEFFCIKPRTVKMKFSGWIEIDNEVAEKHSFTATMDAKIEDVAFHDQESYPEADYRILSFGRTKPYFHKMINDVVLFAKENNNKKINFVFLGDVKLNDKEKLILSKVDNLFYVIIPPQRPIPRAIFDYADLVIATSGCAIISFKSGYKTIAMNVETGDPLGVMGFTTLNCVFNESNEESLDSLKDLLYKVLVNHKFDGPPILKLQKSTHDFNWQVGKNNNDRVFYEKVDLISQDRNIIKRLLESIILHCGGIKLLAKR